MKYKNQEIASNPLRWVYLIGFFIILALPLLNLPPWFSPPDWGKTIVLRIVISILLFLFLWQLLFRREMVSDVQRAIPRGSAKVPFLLLLTLLGVYLLATLFSTDIRFSLWGSPYRSGGFINFASFIAFVLLALVFAKQNDWKKFLNFSIVIGLFVSAIAIFQQFGILSSIFIPQATQLGSTIGGPIFLGMYLVLLSFVTLALGISTKLRIKKLFYFFSLLVFFVVLLLTISQAAYLGFAVGSLYFLFFYPKRFTVLKIAATVLILLGILGAYFLKTHPDIPLSQHYVISSVTRWNIDQSRISAWKVSWEALKEKPLLGYGPENFASGFDKYYDPSLPLIQRDPYQHSSWWDRAHNFIFDISVTAGIPALIIYLTLLGAIFWRLQKVKQQVGPEDKTTRIISHGIQASLIGYLTANFFGFDTFSPHLVFFLLIGYTLQITVSREEVQISQGRISAIADFLHHKRYFIAPAAFLFLLWFLSTSALKPFSINTQMNVAKYFVRNQECEQAFVRMDNVLQKSSFLDAYVRLRYVDFMKTCEQEHPEKTLEYAQKGTAILKENIIIQPNNTRNWLLLGGFTNILIEKEQDEEKKKAFIQENDAYFEKAFQLSPKRQEVFIEWTKFHLVSGEYQKAKEKAQTCVTLNPKLPDCYWLLGLTETFLENLEAGKEQFRIAEERRYNTKSLIALHQLAKAYTVAQNYKELVEVYQQLIALKSSDSRYHSTLAFVYRRLGSFEKAREQAMIVLELNPSVRQEVEAFLKTLP